MEFKYLYQPIKVGSCVLKNRIAMASMNNVSQYSFADGTISERCVEYYKERIKGGTGLVITGVFKVENEIEQSPWPVWTMKGARTVGELTDYAHAYGSKVFVQLSAGAGRNSRGVAKPVSSSAVPSFFVPTVTCRELETEEVELLVEEFGRAACLVADAGIDGIEVHGHEGYLIDQFTCSLFNRRTDKYGGDLDGRLRFPIEILDSIRARVGRNLAVIYRYGAQHFVKRIGKGLLDTQHYPDAGRDLSEAIEIAKRLQEAGYEGLDVDAGIYESNFWAHPPNYQPNGCYVELAARIKREVKIPVLVAGKLGDPRFAETVLKEGKADIIGLGRPLLADPMWPEKVRTGMEEDIRPCIACNDGCTERARNRPLSCSVNPACGREIFRELTPAQQVKRVLIAGGGVAGMEAARTAIFRGHKVSLYEKTSNLGGHLIAASVPDFKEAIRRLLRWYERQLQYLQVDIHLDTEVTTGLVKQESPDVVVIATGSTCYELDIPGVEKSGIPTCSDLLLGKIEAGNNVVVLGGGLVGCETALWLAEQGKNVTIVERLQEIASGLPSSNRNMLVELLTKKGVDILTCSTIQEVKKSAISVINRDFDLRTLHCDTVLTAIGQAAVNTLYDSLETEFPYVCLIGDCKEPRKIHDAIWEGYVVGCSI